MSLPLFGVPDVNGAGAAADGSGLLLPGGSAGGAAELRAGGFASPGAAATGGLSLSSELEDELQAFEQQATGGFGIDQAQTQLMEMLAMLEQLYQELQQKMSEGDQAGADSTRSKISDLEQQIGGLGGGSGASSGSYGGGGGYAPVSGGTSAGGSSGSSSGSSGAGGSSGTGGTSFPQDTPSPKDSDARVQSMIDKADSLLGKPYVFGGGHGGWGPSSGYDCSGFVSAVLHAGGYLSQPVDTTNLPNQAGIERGPGKNVTIYDRAQPGENGHVIIQIDGQFYESGGMKGPWGGGGGVQKIGKPSKEYLSTFETVLHPKGL